MKQAEAPHRRLVILAGPSGAGKTTVRDRLIEGERGTDFTFSVSMTTRPRRPGEREGEDYRFVDRATFEALVASGGMLEHAVVHGDLYGTPADNLDRARAAGRHLLLDIERRLPQDAAADVVRHHLVQKIIQARGQII